MAELNKLNSRIQLKRVSAESFAKHSSDILPNGSPLVVGVKNELTNKRYMYIGDGKTPISDLPPMVTPELNNGKYKVVANDTNLIISHNQNSLDGNNPDGIYGNIVIDQTLQKDLSSSPLNVVNISPYGLNMYPTITTGLKQGIGITHNYDILTNTSNPEIQLASVLITPNKIECQKNLIVGDNILGLDLKENESYFYGDVQIIGNATINGINIANSFESDKATIKNSRRINNILITKDNSSNIITADTNIISQRKLIYDGPDTGSWGIFNSVSDIVYDMPQEMVEGGTYEIVLTKANYREIIRTISNSKYKKYILVYGKRFYDPQNKSYNFPFSNYVFNFETRKITCEYKKILTIAMDTVPGRLQEANWELPKISKIYKLY